MERIRQRVTSLEACATLMRAAWPLITQALKEGHALVVDIYEEKTRKQENLLHSCFADFARDALFHGRKVDDEVWKRALLSAFYEATKRDPEFSREWVGRAPQILPNLDGDGFFTVEVQSRRFSKRLMSAFIESIYAIGAERGVRWSRTSLGRDVPDEAVGYRK